MLHVISTGFACLDFLAMTFWILRGTVQMHNIHVKNGKGRVGNCCGLNVLQIRRIIITSCWLLWFLWQFFSNSQSAEVLRVPSVWKHDIFLICGRSRTKSKEGMLLE